MTVRLLTCHNELSSCLGAGQARSTFPLWGKCTTLVGRAGLLRKANVAVSKAGRLLGRDALITLGAPCVLPRPDAEVRKRRLMMWPFRLGDCQTCERLKIKNLAHKNHWQVGETPSQGRFGLRNREWQPQTSMDSPDRPPSLPSRGMTLIP